MRARDSPSPAQGVYITLRQSQQVIKLSDMEIHLEEYAFDERICSLGCARAFLRLAEKTDEVQRQADAADAVADPHHCKGGGGGGGGNRHSNSIHQTRCGVWSVGAEVDVRHVPRGLKQTLDSSGGKERKPVIKLAAARFSANSASFSSKKGLADFISSAPYRGSTRQHMPRCESTMPHSVMVGQQPPDPL